MDEFTESIITNWKKEKKRGGGSVLERLLMKPSHQNQVNQDFCRPFAKPFKTNLGGNEGCLLVQICLGEGTLSF